MSDPIKEPNDARGEENRRMDNARGEEDRQTTLITAAEEADNGDRGNKKKEDPSSSIDTIDKAYN